jgi:hypothetical protein
MNLESRRPAGPLFRVGRDRAAWTVPDWAYAKEDGTFGNRFDDPMDVYWVLYAPYVSGQNGHLRARSWCAPMRYPEA